MPAVLTALLVGASAALLGSLLGVGGGIIMVPVFVAIGLTMKQAVATSLAAMVATAAVSTLRYQGQNLIQWQVALPAAAGAIVAAYFGTELMKSLSGHQLRMGFGVFLIAVGIYMLSTSPRAASGQASGDAPEHGGETQKARPPAGTGS